MKENMKDTIRIDAKNVDREVGEAFKNYVFKKHGKIRGAFSKEVTKALREYLQRGEIDRPQVDTELRDLNDEATKWFMERNDLLFEEEERLAKLEKEASLPGDGEEKGNQITSIILRLAKLEKEVFRPRDV